MRKVTIAALAAAALALCANVPRPAPELALSMPDGTQLLLSKFRGKVVAVEFLSTTCPHCQNCSVLLKKMQEEFGARGFQPVGVAFNPQAMLLVPDYVRQFGLKFPVGVVAPEQVAAYVEYPAGKTMYVPQLLFIDREGVIRAYYPADDPFFKNEEANMRAQVEALLNAPPARKNTRGRKR